MGQKSVLNQLFNPFGGLGSVRNGFTMHFSSSLSRLSSDDDGDDDGGDDDD